MPIWLRNFTFNKIYEFYEKENEKAVIGFASFMMMCIFAVADIVTGTLGKELVIQEFIFNAFLWMTLGCFGIASVDKYINKGKSDGE